MLELDARRRWWASTHTSLVHIGIAALGVLVFADVRSDLRRADEATLSWSTTRAVWVAAQPLAAGDQVLDGAEVRDVPEALLPDGTLEATDPLAGAVVGRAMAPGAILTALDLRGSGTAPASVIPDGWLIVPVQTPAAGIVAPGDRVRVVAGGAVLSGRGVIVEPGDDGHPTLLAVPADAAPLVASDVAGITLVLEP